MKRIGLCLLVAILLTSCQGIPVTGNGPTPTPFPDSFSGSVDIGSYNLALACEGTGTATIILVQGVGGGSWPIAGMNKFKEVSRTCLYARTDQITHALNKAPAALDFAKELHTLLKKAGVPGPYILVGQDYADFIILTYTKQYPDEVVGLVCVDCLSPKFEDIFMERVMETAPGGSEAIQKIAANKDKWAGGVLDPLLEMETIDIAESNRQALAVTSLGDRPFVIFEPKGEAITEEDQLFAEAWMDGLEELAKLSSKGRFEITEKVGEMGVATSSLTKNVIQEVYDQVK